MNSGICVCVLLAALSSAGLGHPPTHARGGAGAPSAQTDPSAPGRTRQVRSALLGDSPKKLPAPRLDEASLGELLAQFLSRKGKSHRSPTMLSRASGSRASHRIQDRDYLGWMDFGRRSAEEYDYSS